jgi:hypothetical protein
MKLHEIIETMEKPGFSIATELLYPYRKSLLAYYTDIFCCEPVLMITDVFNVGAYGRIVPSNDFLEAIEEYVGHDPELSDEDREGAIEVINFNSRMLKDF